MGRVCSIYMPVVTLQNFKMETSPLIGAWSLPFGPNLLVESGTTGTCQVDFFRPKVDFNDFWPAKSIQRVNIYVSGEFEENRSKSHFCPIT